MTALPRLTLRSIAKAPRVFGRTGVCVLALALWPSLSLPVSAQPSGKMPRKQEEKAPTRTGAAEQQFPFGATWILSEVAGKTVTGDAPSFNLDDKLRATRFGGCNTF